MKNLAVSRRYAKALILIGQEDGLAEHYNLELDSIVTLFDTQGDFEKALTNPLYNKNDRKKVLEAVLSATDLSAIMKSFLILLFLLSSITLYRFSICSFNASTVFKNTSNLAFSLVIFGSNSVIATSYFDSCTSCSKSLFNSFPFILSHFKFIYNQMDFMKKVKL